MSGIFRLIHYPCFSRSSTGVVSLFQRCACFTTTGLSMASHRFHSGGRRGGRSSSQRVSWRLPDVREPGGSRSSSAQLAAFENVLNARHPSTSSAHPLYQLSGRSFGAQSNRVGKLALLKQRMQDPLFTPPHRQPNFVAAHSASRPGGVLSRANKQLGKSGVNKKLLFKTDAFRRAYKDS